MVQHRDEERTGKDVVQGTSVSGTPGVTTYDNDAELMRTLKADPSLRESLFAKDPTDKYLNRIEYAKSLSEKLNAMAGEKGLKFDEVSAEGRLGLSAFGLEISAKASESSRHVQETNVMMGAILRTIDKAEAEAVKKGLTGEKAEQYVIDRLADMGRTVESTVRNVTPILGSYVEKGMPDKERPTVNPLDINQLNRMGSDTRA